MPKRGKYKTMVMEAKSRQPMGALGETPVETAVSVNIKKGGNNTDEDLPKVHVNEKYDAMPDEIADAGAVFKLAFLDSERGRLQTQALLVKQEGDQSIKALRLQYQTTLNDLQRQICAVEVKLKEHKDYIEKKYGIALRSYTYDDETGVLKKQIHAEQVGSKEEIADGY